MASRRTKVNATKERESSEDEIPSSQPSTNSTDEQELKALLKFKAKRTRQQAAMYNEYKVELENAVEDKRVTTVNAFLEGMDVIVKMGDAYLLEQEHLQNTIRGLWVQVANAQAEFTAYTRGYRVSTIELERIRTGRHLDSLSLKKRACEDHQASIEGVKHAF